jgi:1-acyl-sn-glycerol-3-phosphate acyltransferase
MRSVLAWTALPCLTLLFGCIVLVAALSGVRRGGRGEWVYDFAFRSWSRGLLWVSGVTVHLHDAGHLGGGSRILVGNHVSRFDVLALAACIDRISFVAKAELARIPFFGRAAAVVGTIFVERQKSRASIASLQKAAEQIGVGTSVVMFPEGGRSPSYALRPFKKGPFVLAITTGVPIVPTIIHGTLHVHPKGDWRVRSGRVDIHFLEPVPVAGLTYEDRDRLAATVRERMDAFLHEQYAIRRLPDPQADVQLQTPPNPPSSHR